MEGSLGSQADGFFTQMFFGGFTGMPCDSGFMIFDEVKNIEL